MWRVYLIIHLFESSIEGGSVMTDDMKHGQEDEKRDQSIEDAQQVSKVSGSAKSVKMKSNIIWLCIFLIAGVLTVMFFSGSSSKGHPNNAADQATQSTLDNELAENLKRLKEAKEALAIQHNTPSELTTSANLPYSHPYNDKLSKETLVRQNAPTEMYSAGVSTHNGGSTPSGQVAHEAVLNNGGGNAQFANNATEVTSVSAKQILHPNYTIAEGEFIHANLETAINSSLPGMVRAVISQPVYAYSGEKPLIPAGSRLIGQYSSGIVQGQNRVMVVWNRIILPNGISVMVNSPGTDALGRAGEGVDSVNRHFFQRFGHSILLSLIGTGAATGGVGTNDQYNSLSMYRSAVAQSFQNSAGQALKQDQNIKPTLHIYQGALINVFVAHDVSFFNVLHALGAT